MLRFFQGQVSLGLLVIFGMCTAEVTYFTYFHVSMIPHFHTFIAHVARLVHIILGHISAYLDGVVGTQSLGKGGGVSANGQYPSHLPKTMAKLLPHFADNCYHHY